eukprot:gene6074-39164_t
MQLSDAASSAPSDAIARALVADTAGDAQGGAAEPAAAAADDARVTRAAAAAARELSASNAPETSKTPHYSHTIKQAKSTLSGDISRELSAALSRAARSDADAAGAAATTPPPYDGGGVAARAEAAT